MRVGPWQCSCAVFAMGESGGEDGARAEVRVWEGREVGEQGRGGDAEVERRGRREEGGGRGEGREGDDCGGAGHLRFGGLAREEGQGRVPAMCKHLMACLLAESCTEIGKLVRVERLSRQERAGWAADLGG